MQQLIPVDPPGDAEINLVRKVNKGGRQDLRVQTLQITQPW